MKRTDALGHAIGVLTTAAILAGAAVARADEPPAPPAQDVSERLRLLEERAAQVETLNARVEALQSEVVDLRDRLRQYEGQAATPARPGPSPSSDERNLAQDEARRIREEALRRADEIDGSGGYGEGVEISFWGWLTYLYRQNAERSTFWAWEVEMDVTKTFNERLAAGFDLDFVDTNDGAETSIEQLFLSLLVSPEHRTVLTAGKFNAPFGIEARDFWDRRTASLSLLWNELPHDLTGILLTQPLGGSGVTLQGLVVNGFDQNLDVNRQPSLGVVAAWTPDPSIRLAGTYYAGPEMPNNVSDDQYLVLAEGTWLPSPSISFSAEYLYAGTQSPTGEQNWWGVASILSAYLNDRWRLFGRYSYLDDLDGFVTGTPQDQHEAALGFAYYLHPLVEFRTEYRHDFKSASDDEDSVFAHVTFGF